MLRDETVPLPDGTLSAKKGDEVEAPRWVARVLVARGAAKLKDEVDITYLNSYQYRERRTAAPSQLPQLPPDFYIKVSEYLRSLDEQLRTSPSAMLMRDRESGEKALMEIAQLRLSKVIRLAQVESQEDLTASMTPEEALLYTRLRELLGSWKSYVASLAGGEST